MIFTNYKAFVLAMKHAPAEIKLQKVSVIFPIETHFGKLLHEMKYVFVIEAKLVLISPLLH